MLRRHAALWVILAAIALLFVRVSTSFFCGYDDFLETHRANFLDSQHPSKILTETHFHTAKYRPGQRFLSYASWKISGPAAWAFRFRNLGSHLLAVAFVYGIALILSGSTMGAAGAALLFGVHPLSNQVINAAVFGNTLAYAALLGSFFFFLASLEKGARWRWMIAASIILAWVALLTYESTIVVFGFMAAYAVLWQARGGIWPRGYLKTLAVSSGVVLVAFFAVRRMFVSEPMPLVGVSVMAKNTVMYAVSLALPVDSVFSHEVFGTPLPSELKITKNLILAAAGICVAAMLAAGIALRSGEARKRAAQVDWVLVLLLGLGALFSLAPFLAFTPHASETYMYLPAALYAIILSLVFLKVSRSKAGYAACVGVMAGLFAAGTWVRNDLVTRCGATAQHILAQLPLDRWRSGEWDIRLAVPASEPPIHRYGLYGWRGLATIDPGDDPSMPSAKFALQEFSQNERLKVEVVAPQDMGDCKQPGRCFWVLRNGDVKDASR